MDDLEDRVREVKRQIEQARTAQARAENVRDAAKASEDQARARLKQEYDVETSEEAQAKMAELTEALNAEIQAVRDALAKSQ